MAGRKAPSSNSEELMRSVLEKIDRNITDIHKDVSELKHTTIKQQAILDEHIRRTEVNEEAVKQASARIKPLEVHVNMWGGIGKGLVIVGTICSIAVAVIKVIQYFTQF